MSERRLRDQHGASLVELLVAMLIVGVIGTAATASIVAMQRVGTSAHQVREDLDTARIALDRVRREIRSSRGVTPDSTPTLLQLRVAGIDGAAAQLVTWELVGGGDRRQLQRYVGASTAPRQTVADDLLPTSVFTYDQSPPRTSRVDVVLEVASTDQDSLRAEASVRLRNVLD
ncbi:MAG TPA: type II secretion system protein [Egicoccus sp.]|nr:type II secretion system protein [Egicoccus sp.]HSK21851.1 type II secretion system protein [Egicoccus sp.]